MSLLVDYDFPIRTRTPHHSEAYFSIIHLLGHDIFLLVDDPHSQRDGVQQNESAITDNMVEKIRHAAD